MCTTVIPTSLNCSSPGLLRLVSAPGYQGICFFPLLLAKHIVSGKGIPVGLGMMVFICFFTDLK